MKPKLLDIFAALLILSVSLMLAVPSLFSKNSNEIFTVEAGGEISSYSFKTDGEYNIVSAGIHLTVAVKDGAVSVTESSCPDGLCKAMPGIKRSGESIVCLPARVVIRISGEGGSVDGIAG